MQAFQSACPLAQVDVKRTKVDPDAEFGRSPGTGVAVQGCAVSMRCALGRPPGGSVAAGGLDAGGYKIIYATGPAGLSTTCDLLHATASVEHCWRQVIPQLC